MALIKFGGGVVGMAGSIAGTTFARNASGSYARARTKPINNKTNYQTIARDAMAALCSRWNNVLDATHRAAWLLYGQNVAMKNRLGESIFLSGMNHYIRSNANNLQNGNTLHDDAPVIFTLGEKDTTFACSASEATQLVTVTYDVAAGWAVEANGFMYIYQSAPQNLTVNFWDGPWRKLGEMGGAGGGGLISPKTFVPAYHIDEGQKIFFYARVIRADGRTSEKFFCFCNVAA
jgi:hypothetical protein